MEKDKLKKSIVVNAFGGPSAGKTTLASTLYGRMKQLRMSAGFAQEYAQEKVHRGESLHNQFEITGEQYRRIETLYGERDFVITDSPVLLGAMYQWEYGDDLRFNTRATFLAKSAFEQYLIRLHNTLISYNIFVDREGRDFVQEGRLQDLEESKRIDGLIQTIMKDNQIPYTVLSAEADLDQLISVLKDFRRKEYELKG